MRIMMSENDISAVNNNNGISAQDNTPRIAFCSIVAVGGAVLVVHGDDLQGFIWWFLLVFLLGTVLEGNYEYSCKKRLKYSSIIGIFFYITSIVMFLLRGVGLSRYLLDRQSVGLDFKRIPIRFDLFLDQWIFAGFLLAGVGTIIAIYLAGQASSYTLKILRIWNNVSEKDINKFKTKYKVLVVILTGLAALVAHFANS
jgi:hypothetical protein